MIDTGAGVDIIDEDAFSRIQNNSSKKSRLPIPLRKTKTKVYGFGAGKRLPIIGRFDVEIESSSCIVPTTVYVMQGKVGSLLSFGTGKIDHQRDGPSKARNSRRNQIAATH